jgi:hypothetical protein
MTTTTTTKPIGKFAALAEAAAVAATAATAPGAAPASSAHLVDAMTLLVDEARKRDADEHALREDNRRLKEELRRLPDTIKDAVRDAMSSTTIVVMDIEKKVDAIEQQTSVTEARSCITQALCYAILIAAVVAALVWRFWPTGGAVA